MLHDDPMAADRFLRELAKGKPLDRLARLEKLLELSEDPANKNGELDRVARLEDRLERARPVANELLGHVEQLDEDLTKERRDRVSLETRVEVLEKAAFAPAPAPPEAPASQETTPSPAAPATTQASAPAPAPPEAPASQETT